MFGSCRWCRRASVWPRTSPSGMTSAVEVAGLDVPVERCPGSRSSLWTDTARGTCRFIGWPSYRSGFRWLGYGSQQPSFRRRSGAPLSVPVRAKVRDGCLAECLATVSQCPQKRVQYPAHTYPCHPCRTSCSSASGFPRPCTSFPVSVCADFCHPRPCSRRPRRTTGPECPCTRLRAGAISVPYPARRRMVPGTAAEQIHRLHAIHATWPRQRESRCQ